LPDLGPELRGSPTCYAPAWQGEMADTSNAMEGLKLISAWAKWLITIEMAAIGVIGAYLKGNTAALPQVVKILITIAVCSFVLSIAAAALLLLSLPEIAQRISEAGSIWLTRDSVIGRVFSADTQTFATIRAKASALQKGRHARLVAGLQA